MASQQNSDASSLSCLTCRQRKVKCDKQSPCAGCQKSRFSCTYPARARSRTKNPGSNQALKVRLERLENLVQTLDKSSTKDDMHTPLENRSGQGVESSTSLGRLVTEGEESRYIENSFWITLSNEVSSLVFLSFGICSETG